MSDEKSYDKTNVVDGDTLKLRLDEVRKAPPALILLMGPTGLMGKQWFVDRAEMTIGREISCDIQIEEKSLSKKHAKIVMVGDDLQIVDLNSTNGTEIGALKLSPHTPTTLHNNDSIKLGNIIFKYLSQGNIEAIAAATSYDRGTIDGLTQILNKATTLNRLEESFKKAKLTETGLALIIFDLDHFKKINDTFGHQAGDYVLREVAAVVKNQLIRSGDAFGRYGGEEFVIILYGSSLQRACDVAERIRSTIEKHEFSFGGKKIPVTVSLGVAALDRSEPNADALFAKADQAAYRSKEAGRNRVSIV
jgi:two-component system, cell cycle response regulator